MNHHHRADSTGPGLAETPPPSAPPRHHVPEARLTEYVQGSSPPGSALAIACHVTLCLPCRARVVALENLAGLALERVVPVAPAPGALTALLARLEAAHPAPESADEPATKPSASLAAKPSPSPGGDDTVAPAFLAACDLPVPLLRSLPKPESLSWRFLVPGVHYVDLGGALGVAEGATVRLLKLGAGLRIPLHDHGGPEYTVIFTSALNDGSQRFARGDVSIRLPGDRHIQQVDPDEECVALQVNEGPLLALTWKGQLLSALANFIADRHVPSNERKTSRRSQR